MSKVINIVFLIVTAVFVFMLVRANQAGQELKTEHDRLAAKFGSLPIEDESQFSILNIPGEKTQVFQWRAYVPSLPGGLGQLVRTSGGHARSSGSPNAEPKEIRIFAKYREVEGRAEFYYQIDGSSTVQRFDAKMGSFLVDHWNELDFEVMAESGPMNVSPSEVLRVLSVRIPERLHGELPTNLSEAKLSKFKTEPLIEFYVGDQVLLGKLK